MKKTLTIIILFAGLQCLTAIATEQTSDCKFTCNNADYVKPGNQLITDRKPQAINEKTGVQIKKAYDLIQTENPKIKPNPKKALSILKKIDLNGLNSQEKFLVYRLKGFSYISLEDYNAAIECYTKILQFSSEIPAKGELENLEMLATLHNANKNHANALKYLHQWAKLRNQIEPKHYRLFSEVYEKLGDLPHAIANQARALELADSQENPAIADYVRLKELYQLDKQTEESNKIQSILDSIPGADRFGKYPIPIVKAAYEYPSAAVRRKIEGDCIVTFDITPTGSTENLHVKDGDCTTINGQLTDIFVKASIKAAQRFKYAPTIENGKPVYVRNVSNKFSYRIAK